MCVCVCISARPCNLRRDDKAVLPQASSPTQHGLVKCYSKYPAYGAHICPCLERTFYSTDDAAELSRMRKPLDRNRGTICGRCGMGIGGGGGGGVSLRVMIHFFFFSQNHRRFLSISGVSLRVGSNL